MSKTEKPGIKSQIIVAVVVALLAGGTSPWWWKEFFGNTKEPTSLTTDEEIKNEKSNDDKDKIWKDGALSIPISGYGFGRVADLDAGYLLPLGTSISAEGADIFIRQSVHGIVIEPGLSKGDGITFDARFIGVNDNSVRKEGCETFVISPQVGNHLGLLSDVDMGSHICMVTTKGRLAEFTIVEMDLTSKNRYVKIKYEVWKKNNR